MFGYFIGTACVIGLAMMAGRRHRYHHHGYGGHGGFGRHFGGHGHHGGFGRGGGFFMRRGLRRIFENLDTTPAQEKVIATAVDDLRDQAQAAKEHVGETREKVANAIRDEHMDERTFGAIFDEPLERLKALRDEFAKTASTIHETLTPKQRERLSDMVGSGTRWGFRGAC
jgi:Spy/CpxP family protein refolding chaperone